MIIYKQIGFEFEHRTFLHEIYWVDYGIDRVHTYMKNKYRKYFENHVFILNTFHS